MQFLEGDTVIHPHHGPARVMGSITRTVRGEQVEYIELEIEANKLRVSVPLDKTEEVGIREIANEGQLDKLVEVLCGPTVNEEPQWSRRFKANREHICSGNPLRLAAVVRDLLRRRERSSLSLGEKDMLNEASAPLLAEIALAVNVSEDEAREVLHRMVLEESSAVLERIKPGSTVAA